MSKKINPSMLIPRNDCKNVVQKCIVSKMKSMMEIVEVTGKRKGTWKSNNFYLESVPKFNKTFKDVELVCLVFGIMRSAVFLQF